MGASSYALQEQVNSGSWTTMQNSASTSWAASGKGNGTYGYRVQACNAGGCGPWSGTGNVTVALTPSVPTGLVATLKSTSAAQVATTAKGGGLTPQALPSGIYTLSAIWTASAGATRYVVQYCDSRTSTCATAATTVASWPGVEEMGTLLPSELTVSVQACNGSNCSAYSAGVHPSLQN